MTRNGVFTIIHDGNPNQKKRKYLIVRNENSKQLSFIGGGLEESDKDDFATGAIREIIEETGLPAEHYTLKKTPVEVHFKYGNGTPAYQQVFLAQADQYAIKNAHSTKGDAITSKKWMTESELRKAIKRKNIVKTFENAIKYF